MSHFSPAFRIALILVVLGLTIGPSLWYKYGLTEFFQQHVSRPITRWYLRRKFRSAPLSVWAAEAIVGEWRQYYTPERVAEAVEWRREYFRTSYAWLSSHFLDVDESIWHIRRRFLIDHLGEAEFAEVNQEVGDVPLLLAKCAWASCFTTDGELLSSIGRVTSVSPDAVWREVLALPVRLRGVSNTANLFGRLKLSPDLQHVYVVARFQHEHPEGRSALLKVCCLHLPLVNIDLEVKEHVAYLVSRNQWRSALGLLHSCASPQLALDILALERQFCTHALQSGLYALCQIDDVHFARHFALTDEKA